MRTVSRIWGNTHHNASGYDRTVSRHGAHDPKHFLILRRELKEFSVNFVKSVDTPKRTIRGF